MSRKYIGLIYIRTVNRLKEFGLFSTFIEKSKDFVDTLKMAKRKFSKNEVDN
jgi:hypothetical protein